MLATLGEHTVVAEPFPHVVIDGVFDPATYRALADSFPVCPPASGPTGFTIHRGDPQFDTVMQDHPVWRALYETCRAPAFLGTLTALFADEIERSAFLAPSQLTSADHVETRVEKEREVLAPLVHIAVEDIFLRFDFMQGGDSYGRAPHLDHRRRLATVLLYFDAPSPETFAGGDLVLHASDGRIVRRIAPAENRAVLFPCSERSWHSVDQVHACRQPRRFVQISLTSRYAVWPDATLPGTAVPRRGGRARAVARRLLGALLDASPKQPGGISAAKDNRR
uniref:2OG-Fe(II) oxygenase n=1 Tax=uncultured Sphingomonas sp. TaxID=158754 RepID=UPI0035CBFD32